MTETASSMLSFSMVIQTVLALAALFVLVTVFSSFYSIGPTQIGLVRKGLGGSCPAITPWPSREKPVIRRIFSCLVCASSLSGSPL